MKTITFCEICKNPIGIYRCYQVMVIKPMIIPVAPRNDNTPIEKYKAKICPACAKKSGYKIAKKYEEALNNDKNTG